MILSPLISSSSADIKEDEKSVVPILSDAMSAHSLTIQAATGKFGKGCRKR